MTELSPEARALLEATRDSDDPSAEQRARVRNRLATALGATAAVGVSLEAGAAAQSAALAGTSVPAGAAGAALSGKLLSVLALSGIAVAASVGVWQVQKAEHQPQTVATPAASPAPRPSDAPSATDQPRLPEAVVAPVVPAMTAAPQPAPARARTSRTSVAASVAPRRTTASFTPVAAAPSPTVSEVPAEPQAAAAAPTGDAPATPLSSASDGLEQGPAGVAEHSGNSLPAIGPIGAPDTRVIAPSIERELALIGAAQLALRKGDAAEALTLLQRHASEFPRGALTQERLAASAIALCRMGRADAGQGAVAELERQAPSSPLLARARRACHPQEQR